MQVSDFNKIQMRCKLYSRDIFAVIDKREVLSLPEWSITCTFIHDSQNKTNLGRSKIMVQYSLAF